MIPHAISRNSSRLNPDRTHARTHARTHVCTHVENQVGGNSQICVPPSVKTRRTIEREFRSLVIRDEIYVLKNKIDSFMLNEFVVLQI